MQDENPFLFFYFPHCDTISKPLNVHFHFRHDQIDKSSSQGLVIRLRYCFSLILIDFRLEEFKDEGLIKKSIGFVNSHKKRS